MTIAEYKEILIGLANFVTTLDIDDARRQSILREAGETTLGRL